MGRSPELFPAECASGAQARARLINSQQCRSCLGCCLTCVCLCTSFYTQLHMHDWNILVWLGRKWQKKIYWTIVKFFTHQRLPPAPRANYPSVPYELQRFALRGVRTAPADSSFHMLIAFNILLSCFTIQLFIYLANKAERERKKYVIEDLSHRSGLYFRNDPFLFFFFDSWWHDCYKA